MKTIRQTYAERNDSIYAWFKQGMRQKAIAQMFDLSESRIKAIIAEQKKAEKNVTETNLRKPPMDTRD